MQDWRDKLAHYLQRLLTQADVSTHGVARKAKQFGFRLSPTTVWDVANSKNKDVGIETIRAIARGLGVPERELFRQVVEMPPSGRPETPIGPNVAMIEELYSTAERIDQQRIEGTLELLRDYLEFRAGLRVPVVHLEEGPAGNETRKAS